jgi:UDP:flavonoid glycosyltransferase YjiC (YdhE family)
VRLAAPAQFAELAATAGLAFCELAGNPANLAQQLVDRAGTNRMNAIRAIWSHALPIARQILGGIHEACEDADLIVHSFLMTLAGHLEARVRGLPDVSALMFPVFVPTAEFASPASPWRLPAGGWWLGSVNRLTHRVFSRVFWYTSRVAYGWLRRRAAETLPPLGSWPFSDRGASAMPVLFGFSPTVIPRPHDWPAHVHVTGYWFLEADNCWTPPVELVGFLADGPRPVCVGFGSVRTTERERLWRIVLEALDLSGQRAVLLTGWSGCDLGPLPSGVLALEAVPHEWLLPRMVAVVHHGGAGTTAAGLRAGVPAVVVPFTNDQPFWGSVVHRLGAGPAPIPRRHLTARALAAAIDTAVADEHIGGRASDLAASIGAEDGVGEAVRLIEAYARRQH